MNLVQQIIYEDEDILAINKPAGLIVHPDGRTTEPSVSAWLVEKYPDTQGVGEMVEFDDGTSLDRSGVVHRLDRDTSGALLLAKSRKGFECLKEQFQTRTIEKVYYAFIYGSMKEPHGTISLPIGKSGGDFRKFSAGRGAKGEMREATTYFQVLKEGEGVSLVEVKPKTGRTHQIRVHFQALQRPVVADPLYAPTKPKLLGFDRLALHAHKVIFEDTEGETHTVIAPFPEDFQRAFTEIGFVPRDLP
jgi:23S rRNA pseudouridine1911/1915/1917 synthase